MNKENVDSEIYELCGECFLNAMCMARGIFEHNQGQIIFNEVNKLARYEEDEDVRSLALQCMEEMVDRYFQYIDDYVEQICETTFQIAKHDQEDPRKYALNVWITLAQKEKYF